MNSKESKVVTVSELSKAIKQAKYEKIGIDYENALDDAHYILNLFGYGSSILDNMLDREDRKSFYDWQEFGIIKIPNAPEDTTTLYDGREWRIYCIHLDVDNIRKLSERFNFREESEKAAENPYTKYLWAAVEKEKAVT